MEKRVVITNPFDSELIQDNIIEYLAPRDLLNSRLVNHSWNSKILSIQKQQNTRISITAQNIEEYLGILKFKCPPPSQRLNLHINFGICTTKAEFETITNNANEILEILGPSCVDTLTFHSVRADEHVDWLKLMTLIHLISPGLRSLCLFHEDSMAPNFPQKSYFVQPSFPNLRHLYFGWQEETMILFDSILNSEVLNLDELRIMKRSHSANEIQSLYAPDLHFKLKNLINVDHLQKISLALDIGSSGFLHTFRHKLRFDMVRKLQIFILNDETTILGSFIASMFPRITTLKFLFEASSSALTPSYNFPSSVGPLAHLAHFSISSQTNSTSIRNSYPSVISLVNSAYTSNNFPELSFVSTSLGICFKLFGFERYEQEEMHHQHLNNLESLLTVSTLKLSIDNRIDFGNSYTSLPAIMKQLHLLYPNTTYLIINNQIQPLENDNYHKDVCTAILQELVGLERLDILNYCSDWLTEIFNECPDVVSELQSLVHLSLPHPQKKFQPPKIQFAALLAHLPRLELLEIDQEFLPSGTTTAHIYNTAFCELQEIFPNLTIKLL